MQFLENNFTVVTVTDTPPNHLLFLIKKTKQFQASLKYTVHCLNPKYTSLRSGISFVSSSKCYDRSACKIIRLSYFKAYPEYDLLSAGPAAARRLASGHSGSLGRSKTPTAEIERSAYRTPEYISAPAHRVSDARVCVGEHAFMHSCMCAWD